MTATPLTGDTRAVRSRDAGLTGPATRAEMDARIDRYAIAPGRVTALDIVAPTTPADPATRPDRHSIPPGRVAVLDLARRRDTEAVSGADRAVAVGAIVTGIAAAVGIAVGIG
ncbi:hypothetical protein [Georgenia sp. Z1491]|uniref:hypothetical protein n=1 Tax=Georgenia sp. Z1491 TaxID=3416707 RepID=UPI003CED690A